MRKKLDFKAILATATKPEVNEQMTFNELVSAWLATTNNGDDLYRLRKWQDAFGDRVAWSITSDEIAHVATNMVNHDYAPGSVNRDVGAMGSMYRWIVQQRRAPAKFVSPTLMVARFTEDKRVVEVEDETIAKLRSLSLSYTNKRFAVFVHLLIDTGARKSELLERRWADFDLDKRRIYLRAEDTKTKKARVLYFSEKTAALIRRKCPSRPDSALVFPGRDPSEPVNFRTSWQSLVKDAGCPDLHMHDLRHHRARELLLGGVAIAKAAQVMGHSVQVLESRYGHLSVDDMQQAAELTWGAAA